MKVLARPGRINTITTGAIHFVDKPHTRRHSHINPEQERIALLIELQKDLSKVLPEEEVRKVLILFSALYIKDRDTALHSLRVRDCAVAIAGRCNLTYEEEVAITVGAPLHDIGKIGCPHSLFTNTGHPNTLEKDAIRNHPGYGAFILQQAGLGHIPGLVDIAEKHHERINKSGYPHGLKGSNIPLIAMIVAIADSFDTMTSDRPYKEPLDEETAMQKLWEEAHYFDNQIVRQI